MSRSKWIRSLEGKFVLTAFVLIVTGALVFRWWFLGSYSKLLLNGAELRAEQIARSEAVAIENALLYDELGLIEEEGIIDADLNGLLQDPASRIVGIRVFDVKGKLRNSTDMADFADRSKSTPPWGPGAVREWSTEKHGGRLRIIAPLSVSSRVMGSAVFDFTLEPEFAQIRDFEKRMLAFLSALAMVGVMLAMFIARKLAAPIKRLAQQMQEVHPPDYTADIGRTRDDEIGVLQQSFGELLRRLRAAHVESEARFAALMQTEKLATVGTLVAGLAHEINNPLSGSRNCLDRIRRAPDKTEQVAEYSELIDEALQRIEALVAKLLHFARQDSFEAAAVDLNESIGAAVRLSEYRAQRRRVRVRKHLYPVPLVVDGNAGQVEQVVTNVLVNAIDAIDAEGSVEVFLGREHGDAVIRIRDDGPGVPDELLDRIFDPFFTTKSVGEGTGLGLWIVREILDRHHGRIGVRNLTKGAEFEIRIPLAEANRITPLSIALLAGGRSSRMGRHKALIEWQGETILEGMARRFQELTDDFFVCGDPDGSYRSLDLPVIEDHVKGCGPLGGLLTALRTARHECCFIAPCDVPRLDPRLVDALALHCADHDAVVLRSSSGLEPLIGVYSRRCLPAIEAAIEKSRYKVQDLLDHLEVEVVDVDTDLDFINDQHVFNVNTPGDLARLRNHDAGGQSQ